LTFDFAYLRKLTDHHYSILKTSSGAANPNDFLGLLFNFFIITERSASVKTLKSLPFFRYYLTRPFIFSFKPRSQDEQGWAKLKSAKISDYYLF